jgi:hypothetical protein
MQKKETSEAPPTNCALFPPFLNTIKQQQNINIQKNILPLPHPSLTKYQLFKNNSVKCQNDLYNVQEIYQIEHTHL